jgi:hypothetical protein
VIAGNTVAVGQSASWTGTFLTAFGFPHEVHVMGSVIYNDASEPGSNCFLGCDYAGSANLSSIKFKTSAGTFVGKFKIEVQQ